MSDGRRKTTRKKKWVKPFLAALAKTGDVNASAKAANIHRSLAYAVRQRSNVFAAAWARAIQESIDDMIVEARRRAISGIEEPVIYQGQLCGRWVDMAGNTCSEDTPCARFVPLTVNKRSDILLMFLIKGKRVEYKDRVSEPSQINVGVQVNANDTIEQIRQIERELALTDATGSQHQAGSNGDAKSVVRPETNGKH